jgi:hypothetical protein
MNEGTPSGSGYKKPKWLMCQRTPPATFTFLRSGWVISQFINQAKRLMLLAHCPKLFFCTSQCLCRRFCVLVLTGQAEREPFLKAQLVSGHRKEPARMTHTGHCSQVPLVCQLSSHTSTHTTTVRQTPHTATPPVCHLLSHVTFRQFHKAV